MKHQTYNHTKPNKSDQYVKYKRQLKQMDEAQTVLVSSLEFCLLLELVQLVP